MICKGGNWVNLNRLKFYHRFNNIVSERQIVDHIKILNVKNFQVQVEVIIIWISHSHTERKQMKLIMLKKFMELIGGLV